MLLFCERQLRAHKRPVGHPRNTPHRPSARLAASPGFVHIGPHEGYMRRRRGAGRLPGRPQTLPQKSFGDFKMPGRQGNSVLSGIHRLNPPHLLAAPGNLLLHLRRSEGRFSTVITTRPARRSAESPNKLIPARVWPDFSSRRGGPPPSSLCLRRFRAIPQEAFGDDPIRAFVASASRIPAR
jgi:hypothetical protein